MRVLAIFLGVLAVSTPAVRAQSTDMMFQSPSGNISCILGEFGAFCAMSELTPSYTSQPADCEFDWGSFFEVGVQGRGGLGCVSDYFWGPATFTLPYGGAVSFQGVTCRSETTGMTCQNANGGGFALRRAAQRIF